MATETYALIDFPNDKADPARLESEIIADAAITTQVAGVTVSTNVRVEFLAALSAPEKTALDAVVAAHSGEPLEENKPTLVTLDVPTDTQDNKPVFVMSPATEGWNTWLMGGADNLTPTPPDTGRGTGVPFCIEFTAAEVTAAQPDPAIKVVDFDFLEELEIHDGQVNWSNPQVEWTHEDAFSLGVLIPANPVTPNGGGTGNCHVVNSNGDPWLSGGQPDAAAGFYIIVPAPGNGTYDVDLAIARPIPTPIDARNGYFDCEYDGGAVTVSASPGAAECHLFTVDVVSWLCRNISMLASTGIWDIDVYKTEWFHRRWKLRWEVKKKTVSDGVTTGWILAFRRSTQ